MAKKVAMCARLPNCQYPTRKLLQEKMGVCFGNKSDILEGKQCVGLGEVISRQEDSRE